MTWEDEWKAARRKVESLGGADMDKEAVAILNLIDDLMNDLAEIVLDKNVPERASISENIITVWQRPPVPTRDLDWCAYYEDDVELGQCGYGPTEQDAINDLRENYGHERSNEERR